jgi:hypothetical protein
MARKIISKFDCFQKIKELTEEPTYAYNKKQKLGTFENLSEILYDFDVSVTQAPVEKKSREKWNEEKKKILKAFTRVLDEKKKFEKHPNTYKIEGDFFDSNDYDLLIKLVKPTTDDDYVMDLENEAYESDFEDTAIQEKTKEILDLLLKTSSDFYVPFDKLVAKVSMQYFYTTGENYDKSKGDMFNKVVTLMKF